MLTMEGFYKRMSRQTAGGNRYLKTLFAVTRASRAQLDILKSDLAWQEWTTVEKAGE